METCGQRTRSVGTPARSELGPTGGFALGTPARSEAGGASGVIISRRGNRRDQKIGAIGENSCCYREWAAGADVII